MIRASMSCDLAIFSVWQRCGSTLLQRIASRRPDTMIWGESGRWPNHFANLLHGGLEFSAVSAPVREIVLSRRAPRNIGELEMLANMAPEAERCAQGVIRAMRAYFDMAFRIPGFRYFGFKEVCIENDAIRLFCRAFPNSEVILLVRDPLSIWRSLPDDWIDYPVSDFLAQWNQSYALFQELDETHPRAQLVYFEDLLRHDPRTMDALRRAFVVREEDILAELGVKGVSTNTTKDSDEEEWISRTVACERYRVPREAAPGSVSQP
jgi:hypothetical protein